MTPTPPDETTMPAVTIEGMLCRLLVERQNGVGDCTDEAKLADLCAFVAAIDDRQLIDVLEAAGVFESNKRVAEAWSREMKAKHEAQDQCATLQRELDAERERCAAIVEACRPPLVDGTTHLVRQQLQAIADCIRSGEAPPPPDPETARGEREGSGG